MKNLKLFLILFLAYHTWSFAQVDTLLHTVLSPEQLQEDFNLYRSMLQESHPGLYRYTPKAITQSRLDSILVLLNQPMPFYEFYKILAAFNAQIRCAHTQISPGNKSNSFLFNQTKTLPFFLYPVRDRYYVIFNGSDDNTVKPGYELTHINGKTIETIVQYLKRHLWADGYIERSKDSKLQGASFVFNYYTLVERCERFDLIFKDLNGEELERNVPAQKFSATNKNFVSNPINKEMMRLYNKKSSEPWRIEFLKDLKNVAVLRFESFGGKGINDDKEAKISMQKFMDKALAKMKKKGTQYMILDLRDNKGGWDIHGVELFTYLMKNDSAVNYYRSLSTITNNSKFLKSSDLSTKELNNIKDQLQANDDGTFALLEENTLTLGQQSPKPNKFFGKLYILMDEGTSSSAAEFLAVAKSYATGILVGEESGGAHEGGNGGSFINLTLPHSKIVVISPLVYYENAVKPVKPTGRGTMPDYFVTAEPEDLMTGYDRQFEFVKDLIRQEELNSTNQLK